MIRLSDHLYIEPMGKVLDEARQKRAAGRPLKRYAAANVNRQNADWTTRPMSANWSLYRNLATLRARARQMAKDSPHFRKYLEMCKSNIIGAKGIQLQCRARIGRGGSLNRVLNKRIEEAFWEWGHRETATVSGKLDWLGAQRLFVEQLVRDGEVLIQHIDADNRFGYAMKFWNVDYLDETYNDELPGGNRVIMSVEFDRADRPAAYWLTTPASDINFTRRRTRQRVRIPADQMSHAFLVNDDETQARGVTWFHAALLHAKDLHEYTGGVVLSARVAAYSMGFLKKAAPDETQFTGQENDEGYPEQVAIDVAPVSFNELPDGYELQQFDPKQPTQNHSEFKRSMLMDVATGLGVNYFSLAGDMSDVNYSSARVGLGEERDGWCAFQNFVATHFCREVYHRWLRSASMRGAIDVTPRQFQELMNPMWRPRGWRYVDPQKEVNAEVLALQNNLATYTDIFADRGIDINEWLETKAMEKTQFEEYGIDYGPTPAAGVADEPDDEDEPPPADDEERGYANGKYHVN